MEHVDAVAKAVGAGERSGFLSQLSREIRGHAVFWVIALTIMITSIAAESIARPEGADDVPKIILGLLSFAVSMVPALAVLTFFRLAVIEKSASPVRDFLPVAKRFLTEDGRFLRGAVMMMAIYAFISGFSRFKALIAVVNPFSWDTTFDTWDTALHFGVRPWELLQPILGYGPVTMLINVNYNFWFVSLTAFWLYFAFAERSNFRRNQAIMAYMSTWAVGGIVLAHFFSSAGPCYFDRLNLGFNPYAGLMSYLHATNSTWPIWAVDLQETLWANLISNQGIDVGKGISAMPSMHNAQCLLLVFATWNRGAVYRNLAVAHCVLVFLGSVHLGWHYAVDAYLAFAVAAVAWLVSTRIARAMEYRGVAGLATH